MKSRLLSLLIMILLPLWVVAQTQQGYVKTKGRMVNGKHIPGQGLKGATVSIQDRTPVVVQSVDGSFSFPIPARTFMLQGVQKKGYQLLDTDVLKKSYNYSTNPIYLVMETPEQQTQDQLDSERKIRRTLQRKLQQREDELEALKEANRITLEEYQQAMQRLYADQENNEKLIADMAKRYAQMDYDQMDDLNQRISDAILNGRLTEADSLLRSKGDMKNRVAEIRREQQSEAQRETEIAQEQAALAEAKAGTQKRLEDIASDCQKFFDLCKLNMQWDSATYYIEIRAELDTANSDWQLDAGSYFYQQKNYNQAEKYYLRGLAISRSQDDFYSISITLNNLATLYSDTQRFKESEIMYIEALRRFRLLLETAYHQQFESDLAVLLNNLANLYSDTQRFKESETMYLEALEIRRRLAKDNPQAYESDLAATLGNLSILYNNTKRFTESEAKGLEAAEIFRHLAKDNPQTYQSDVAKILNNIAGLYSETQRFKESETMYLEALEIDRRLANDNPQAYEPYVATTLNNLGILYSDTQRLTESETTYQEALEIYRRLAKDNPQTYEPYVATTLNNLGILYKDTQRLAESETAYQEALEIYRRLAKDNPQAYEPDVATTLHNLSILYKYTDRFAESEAKGLEVAEIFRRLAKDNPQAYESDLAKMLNNLAILYSDTRRFKESETIYLEVLEIRRNMAKSNPQAYEPDLAKTLFDLAMLYQTNKRPEESEIMHREALEIRTRLAKADPHAYEPDQAMSHFALGLLENQQKKYQEALHHFEASTQLFKKAMRDDPSRQRWYERSLYWLVQTNFYSSILDHKRCYEVYEEYLPISQKKWESDPAGNQKDYISLLGGLSFHSIFVGQLTKSEQYAHEALAIDSTQHWIYTNLAATLLFQGRYDEAEQIYQQYKDELKDGFLGDFEEYEKAGIIPEERKADVERIRKMLNE